MIYQYQKNVLRGIHGDNRTSKLITCLYGKFLLVVVNNDKKVNNIENTKSLYFLIRIISKF